jgi:glutamate formiminotransferase
VVTDSEIVGLVPEAALPDGTADRVKLAAFDEANQVLERLIERAAA